MIKTLSVMLTVAAMRTVELFNRTPRYHILFHRSVREATGDIEMNPRQ